MKRVRVPDELVRLLKIRAASENRTLEQVVREAVVGWLNGLNDPRTTRATLVELEREVLRVLEEVERG